MAKKAVFPSLTTPGHRMELKTWLVEIIMVRANKGVKLPAKFWSDSRWKWKFVNELKAVTKSIKRYGEGPIIRAVYSRHLTTFTSYGELEVALQAEDERAKRLKAPKDLTESKPIEIEQLPDLRENKPAKKKAGLFDRLTDMEK